MGAHTFHSEISWLANSGISTGWAEDNTFRPAEDVTRMATAAFLMRFDEAGYTVLPGTPADTATYTDAPELVRVDETSEADVLAFVFDESVPGQAL